MKVLVTGGSGLVASALGNYLGLRGHRITLVSRQALPIRAIGEANEIRCITWQQLTPAFMLRNRFDSIVNLAGTPMMSYWTERRKAEIIASRLECTTRIYTLIRLLPRSIRPECVINASSVAIYSSSRTPVNEWTRPNRQSPFFQAQVWQRVEDRVRQLRVPGVRSILLRMGVIIGADPLMKSLLWASRLHLNFVMGSGSQQISWISRSDLLRILEYLLNHRSKAGIFNVVAPNCVTAHQFSADISASVGRRCRLRLPERPLKLLLGELATNFLISAEVRPQRLLDDAFRWQHGVFREAVSSASRELGFIVAGATTAKPMQPSAY
jgi:uncharacterized protein (TIGR01777 family)